MYVKSAHIVVCSWSEGLEYSVTNYLPPVLSTNHKIVVVRVYRRFFQVKNYCIHLFYHLLILMHHI